MKKKILAALVLTAVLAGLTLSAGWLVSGCAGTIPSIPTEFAFTPTP